MDYFLEVYITKEVIETWSAWRGGLDPTTSEACEAVIHYATHDAYLPNSAHEEHSQNAQRDT